MFDFALTEEQRAIQKAAADFADAWLVPNAARMDEARALDPKVLEEAARLGFYGMNVPAEHGGLGLDTVSMGLVAAEFGRACGSTALHLFAHTVLASEHIRRLGSDAQRRAHLPKMARGEWCGAWALTEPGGGSDVTGMRTRAEPDGDGWRITGEKCFITNGSIAGVVVVTARTPDGYGAFVVRKGAPGFSAARSHELACMRASDTASLHFDGCRVDGAARLGGRGALHDALGCLDLERVVAGAMMTAMARELLRRSL
ncbi:MAG: acyl-CoA dehydrogenase family protein, partial [Methanobacteriota archaeon]